MLSKVISKDALAIILDSESIENDYIIYAIRNELVSAGIEPWQCVDADVYVCDGKTLVMARPSSPLCVKGINVRVRRVKSS